MTSSIGEPSNLIPLLASDGASAEISRLIFNGLVKYGPDLKLTGDLAERWELLDSGQKIIFYLRKDVLWQDGAPFTAKDVKFTFDRLRDPGVPTPYAASFDKVKSLRVLDDLTVQVDYSEPFSPGLVSWTMGIIPEHLLRDKDFKTTDFRRHPVGTGPYRLEQWLSGQQLVLTANKRYFEGVPNIERYVYRIIPDQATTFLELQAEALDGVALSPLQFEKQTETPFFKKNYTPYHWSGRQYTYLAYNLKNPLFSDPRVRHALGMAVDKEEIIRATLLGHGRVSAGPFLAESWASDPTVKPGAYDPEGARRLLKEAGWVDSNGDGLLEKEGHPFSFTVLTNQGNDQRKMICELIQKRWRDIGVDMKIQVVEWSVLLKEFIQGRRFEAVLLAWSLSLEPDDVYAVFHSSQTAPGQFNFVSYKNSEVDGLLEKGRTLFSVEERVPIYQRVHRLIAEDAPYLFLVESEALLMLHRRFEGVTVTPLGVGYDFIHWAVPLNKQKYKITLADA